MNEVKEKFLEAMRRIYPNGLRPSWERAAYQHKALIQVWMMATIQNITDTLVKHPGVSLPDLINRRQEIIAFLNMAGGPLWMPGAEWRWK